VIAKLPKYLIVHIKRFSKNTQTFLEKNPTIVNFPIKNLELGHYTDLPVAQREAGANTKFHLMNSIQHDGPPETGSYRAFVHFPANDGW
jgi:U4/U6.U5 tri-snRNP-associated protein 2